MKYYRIGIFYLSLIVMTGCQQNVAQPETSATTLESQVKNYGNNTNLSASGRKLLTEGLTHLKQGALLPGIALWEQFVETSSHGALVKTVRTYLILLTREEGKRHANKITAEEHQFGDIAPKANVFAVIGFINESGEKPLHKAFMHMMTTDLAHIPHFKVVERARIDAVMSEFALSAAHLLENNHQLGQLLGASHIVSGSILFNSRNESLQISSFIGETKTENLVGEQDAKGNSSDFFTLQKEILYEILLEMNVSEKDMPSELHKIHTKNWLAFKHFSEGLHLLDEGRYHSARQWLELAVSEDPEFHMARDMLATIPEQEYSLTEMIDQISSVLEN